MKIKQPNVFPKDLVKWVSNVREKPLANSLQRCIISSIADVTNEFDFESVTQDIVDSYDEQYFDLFEMGNKKEGMVYFRLARLALAAIEMRKENVERALYEYLAFVDWDNHSELIESLEGNL